MKVAYSLTFKEYLRQELLTLRVTVQAEPWRVFTILVCLILLLITPPGCEIYTRSILPPPYLVPIWESVLFGAGLFLGYPAIYIAVTPLSWLFFRRGELEMDPEKAACRRNWNKSRSRWANVTILEEEGDYILIGGSWVKPGGVLGVLLPRRAFPTEEAATAFFEQAVAYRDKVIGDRPVEAENLWPPAPKPAKSEPSEP